MMKIARCTLNHHGNLFHQGQSEFVRINLRTNKIVEEDETWNGEEEMEVASKEKIEGS